MGNAEPPSQAQGGQSGMRNGRTEFGKMQEEGRVMERPILETKGGEH